MARLAPNSPNTRGYPYILQLDSNGKEISSQHDVWQNELSLDWTPTTQSFVMEGNATQIAVELRFELIGAGGAVFIDDVSLTKN